MLRQFVLRAPPNLVEGFGAGAIREAFNALGTANILRGLSLEQQRNLLDLFTRSAGEMLDERFESDLVKALFGFDAIVGNYASPYAPGSAYVMLHHAFGEVNGKKGVWGHAIGGMGAITQAMATRRARGRRRDRDSTPACARSSSRSDRAAGVVLENGETIRAKYVVGQRQSETALYAAAAGRTRWRRSFSTRMRRWRNGSGTFRMNVALCALPSFTALPGDGDHLTAGIILAPSLALHGPRLSRRARPWLEPRADRRDADPLDARRHAGARGRSMSRACSASMSRRELPDGKSWDDHREEVADLMIATVDRYAPGFAASVIGRQALSPLDLERQFGLLGGDIFHGALTLEPAVLGAADAGPCRLSRPVEGALPLRLRRPSRRRRHRRARPQRRASDPGGSPRPVCKPLMREWTSCG